MANKLFKKILGFTAVVAVIFVVGGVAVWIGPELANGIWQGIKPEEDLDSEAVEAEIITEINQVRKDEGLQPLETNDDLDKAAEQQSDWMANNSVLTHQSPAGGPKDRIQQHYSCDRIGENVAQNHYYEFVITDSGEKEIYKSNEALGEAIARQWENSSRHYDVLTSKFDETAVAVTPVKTGEDGGYVVYATQVFCG